MPNWAYNQVAIVGKKKEVNAFICLGLKNSSLEITDDIETNFNKLFNEGKHKGCKKRPADVDAFEKGYEDEVCLVNGVTLRTFLPMPDTYLMHDTTNNPNSYDVKVIEEQMAMGAVGWYGYNLMTLGTKWDSDIDNMQFRKVDENVYEITFDCDTAWSIPDAWYFAMKDKFPNLRILLKATEESNAFMFVAEVCEDGLSYYGDDFADEHETAYNKWEVKYNEVAERLKKEGVSDADMWDKVVEEIGEFNDEQIFDDLYDCFVNTLSDIEEEVAKEEDDLDKLKEIYEVARKSKDKTIKCREDAPNLIGGFWGKGCSHITRIVADEKEDGNLAFYTTETYPIVVVNIIKDRSALHNSKVSEIFDYLEIC